MLSCVAGPEFIELRDLSLSWSQLRNGEFSKLDSRGVSTCIRGTAGVMAGTRKALAMTDESQPFRSQPLLLLSLRFECFPMKEDNEEH